LQDKGRSPSEDLVFDFWRRCGSLRQSNGDQPLGAFWSLRKRRNTFQTDAASCLFKQRACQILPNVWCLHCFQSGVEGLVNGAQRHGPALLPLIARVEGDSPWPHWPPRNRHPPTGAFPAPIPLPHTGARSVQTRSRADTGAAPRTFRPLELWASDFMPR
jgi:hypothetical protein